MINERIKCEYPAQLHLGFVENAGLISLAGHVPLQFRTRMVQRFAACAVRGCSEPYCGEQIPLSWLAQAGLAERFKPIVEELMSIGLDPVARQQVCGEMQGVTRVYLGRVAGELGLSLADGDLVDRACEEVVEGLKNRSDARGDLMGSAMCFGEWLLLLDDERARSFIDEILPTVTDQLYYEQDLETDDPNCYPLRYALETHETPQLLAQCGWRDISGHRAEPMYQGI